VSQKTKPHRTLRFKNKQTRNGGHLLKRLFSVRSGLNRSEKLTSTAVHRMAEPRAPTQMSPYVPYFGRRIAESVHLAIDEVIL